MADAEVALQIRHVPDRVHAVLRRRAATRGQSLQEYLLALLTEHAEHPTLQEALTQAGSHTGGRIGVQEAADEVRALRDAG